MSRYPRKRPSQKQFERAYVAGGGDLEEDFHYDGGIWPTFSSSSSTRSMVAWRGPMMMSSWTICSRG